MVVDRLTKYAHFVTVSHPYAATGIAQLFLDNIYKLHGMPEFIVSGRDLVFVSKVFQELFSTHGVTLSTSTACHPKSDGQIELLSRWLETFLRCYCSDASTNWFLYILLVVWWYTTHHSTIQTTSPIHLPYLVINWAGRQKSGSKGA